jgi:outer membrane protein assembly factor BamB
MNSGPPIRAVVVLLAVMLQSGIEGCTAQEKTKTMNTIFYRDDVKKPITLSVPPAKVHAASELWAPAPQSPDPAHGFYYRPFANAMRNSRLPHVSGTGFRKIQWQADLDSSSHPRFVLNGGGRVLVQKDFAWELFDDRGSRIIRGGSGAGDIFLDGENGLFYTTDQDGLVVARKLLDGKEAYAFFPMFGSGYDRTVLAREKRNVWVIGIEIPQVSHSASRPAEYTVMEVQDLGDSLKKDEDGILISNLRVATLIARPVPLLTAMTGSKLVLGAPDHVYVADERLTVTGDLTFTGTPETMSLDEEGRIYLVAQIEDENKHMVRVLMVVSPDGSELLRTRLSGRSGNVIAPPLVGYDHMTYLLQGDTIVAVGPEGSIRWETFAGGSIAGAVATGDGKLLVSAGSIIASYGGNGERDVQFALEGEHWATPPVITAGGKLIAASDKKLYCLEARR